MNELSARPSRKRRAKFLVGITAIAVAIVALVTWAITRPGSTAFFYTPTELAGLAAPALEGGEYRVNGNVLPDTVERDGATTTFDISDGETEVTVVTDAVLPDAFWTAMANDSSEVEVIAQGRYDGERFAASQVLAKCPSKFKAKAERA